MTRIAYWICMILLAALQFGVGYLIGYFALGDDYLALATVSSFFAYITVGYVWLKEIGYHGGWAILTPFILPMIVIGCLPRRTP